MGVRPYLLKRKGTTASSKKNAPSSPREFPSMGFPTMTILQWSGLLGATSLTRVQKIEESSQLSSL